jgi:hypothetical protein
MNSEGVSTCRQTRWKQGDKSASERRVTACLVMTDRKLGAKWATIPDWELIGNAAGDGGFRFHDAAI